MSFIANISTNIVRDESKNIDFVATPNTKEIFERIFVYNHGATRSFSLIGNYGTGKSTFLWALEKNLNGEKIFFENLKKKDSIKGYQFIKIIGDNSSFAKSLGKALSLKEVTNAAILEELQKRRSSAIKKQLGIIILVDEFGKFLENASKNGSLDELYLLQQISEWANDADYESYFIITLHQNFSSYSNNLSSQDKLEWEKIKGRFVDLIFNEPVEQLIFFAGQKLAEFGIPKDIKSNFKSLTKLIANSKLVNFSETNYDLSESLFPLDWLSTNILVNSLQRYGQNERSLFSFLNDDSSYSVKSKSQDFYSVARVFDYLTHTLPSEINSAENPHRPQWYTTFRVLERAELLFENEYFLAAEVIKTIGLVNIFSKAGGLFDKHFIIHYFKITKNKNVENILADLENASLIRFYKHSNKINFLEGTDIDLEQELINVSKEINSEFGIGAEIKALFDYPIELVKRYSFETGTPRFFEYRIFEFSEIDNISSPEGSIDGHINLIFENVKLKQLKEKSKNLPGNIFVLYKNSIEIKDELFRIKQFDLLIERYQQDRNALRLLSDEREYHLFNLKEMVVNQLFNNEVNTWIHQGIEEKILNKNRLYNWLAEICFSIYHKTPVLKNELINKEHLSAPINTARKYLIRALLYNLAVEDLNFDEKKFPPEKAIYISLLRRTGLHKRNEQGNYYELSDPPADSKLRNLWDESCAFLDSTLSNKRNVNELVEFLVQPPFKLKRGLVDFWLPIFLIAKQEDFALFHIDGGYIPFLDEDTLDLIHKKPQNFLIKSYDITGLKINLLESYKELVQIDKTSEGTQSTFLSIYGNFLRFYRGLNNYTLRTQKLSNKAINLREAITQSKDPEDALFNKFPAALGYHSMSLKNDVEVLQSFSAHIQEAIRELRNSYNDLLYRIEAVIISSFFCSSNEFSKFKEEIVLKLNSINPEVLGKVQGVFYKRLISPLDDRASWIKSVADVALGKSIEEMLDEEEVLLMNSLEDFIEGLLKASEIHTFNKTSKTEKLLAFRFFGETGKYVEERLIINSNSSQALSNVKGEISSLMKKLELNERKEILIDLLTKDLNL